MGLLLEQPISDHVIFLMLISLFHKYVSGYIFAISNSKRVFLQANLLQVI